MLRRFPERYSSEILTFKMVSTSHKARHRISNSAKIIAFVEISILVTMAVFVLKYKSLTMVTVPVGVVPVRQMSPSNGSVSTASPEMSVISNRSLSQPYNWSSSMGLPDGSSAIQNNLTRSDNESVTTATQITTAVSGLPKVCNNSLELMPKGSMPVIALASLPGSGNTWLRYLIERVTGIYTGSIYRDKRLIKGGFLGESCRPFTGQTVVVKMHYILSPSKIQKTVFLVRNLYEAMQSQFSLEMSRGHTGIVKQPLYKRKEWPECIFNMLRKWEDLIGNITTYFGRKDKLLVVHYQDLKEDPPKELRRIIKFLDLELDEGRLKCTTQDMEGNFHRPKHTLPFDPFQGALRTLVQKAITQTENIWKRHNLTQLRVS